MPDVIKEQATRVHVDNPMPYGMGGPATEQAAEIAVAEAVVFSDDWPTNLPADDEHESATSSRRPQASTEHANVVETEYQPSVHVSVSDLNSSDLDV